MLQSPVSFSHKNTLAYDVQNVIVRVQSELDMNRNGDMILYASKFVVWRVTFITEKSDADDYE